jgi:uncharacterized RDD family membrane protein YckC
LRQSAQEDAASTSWKQEVNRRVAEHKVRKGQPASGKDAPTESLPNGSSGAKAAARVAARYAKAPSYSEMLAEEARAAVRSAEAVSRAALQAQAAAEAVLAELEASSAPSPEIALESEFFTAAGPRPPTTPAVEPDLHSTTAANATIASPSVTVTAQVQSFEIRWDADMPVRESGLAAARASHVDTNHGDTNFESSTETQRQERRGAHDVLDVQGFEVVEAAQPIHANLIQFPRELVATRKARPRRAEGPYAASLEAACQLSIFEVELSAISTEPEAVSPRAETGTNTWVGPDWSGIELDEEPRQQIASPAPAKVERPKPGMTTATMMMELPLAPLNQRILAAIVDFSLITAAFLAAVLVAVSNTSALPPVKEIELGSMVVWALIGALYQAFFFTLSRATPGMNYAHLALCTFTGKRPAPVQRCLRAAALFLSLVPLGLGVIWAIFDEQTLTWHDRLSGTYLRKG